MTTNNRIHTIAGMLSVITVFIGLMLFAGCDGNNTTGPEGTEVVDVIISPESTSIEAGEQVTFTAYVVTANGDEIKVENLDTEWEGKWWSSDTEVFTVENGGTATGQASGEAFCIVEIAVDDILNERSGNPKRKSVNSETAGVFVGRDSAFVTVLK